MLKLTTNHALSSYKIPVFVDGDNNILDYSKGIKKLRKFKRWSTRELADNLGYSPRTIEGWEQGRIPPLVALKLLQTILSTPRFERTFCSQCGREFGPGASGYSECKSHKKRSLRD